MSADNISNAAIAFIAQSASCSEKLMCTQPYTAELDAELAALEATVVKLRAHIKETTKTHDVRRPTYAQMMAMRAVVEDLLLFFVGPHARAAHKTKAMRRLCRWWKQGDTSPDDLYSALVNMTVTGMDHDVCHLDYGAAVTAAQEYLDSTIKLHFKAAGVCPYTLPGICVSADDE